MPETTTATTDGTTSATTSSASDTKVEFSDEQQKHVNSLLADQKRQVRNQFADYDDLKTKAAEYDKASESTKSEVEKANDKAAKALAEVEKVPAKVADALREHLVELHGIDQDKAELFLTATEPSLLLRQIKALLGDDADRKKNNNKAPDEGTVTTSAGTDRKRDFVRNLTDRT